MGRVTELKLPIVAYSIIRGALKKIPALVSAMFGSAHVAADPASSASSTRSSKVSP